MGCLKLQTAPKLRLLTSDPIGYDSGDPNYYKYALDNPLIYTDPTGLLSCKGKALLGGVCLAVGVVGVTASPVPIVKIVGAGLGGTGIALIGYGNSDACKNAETQEKDKNQTPAPAPA